MSSESFDPGLGAQHSTFTHYDASGARSEHPRPRCDCDGIFDPHESKDAAVCRDCGKEVTGEEHFRAMRAIVAKAAASVPVATPDVELSRQVGRGERMVMTEGGPVGSIRIFRDANGEPMLKEPYQPERTPAGLGAQAFEQALATTIDPPPRETSGLPVIRAESFRQDNDGDVMVKIRSPGGKAAEVAIDDPLALLAVTMAAIKFGHGLEMLQAAQKLVADFGKEPTR